MHLSTTSKFSQKHGLPGKIVTFITLVPLNAESFLYNIATPKGLNKISKTHQYILLYKIIFCVIFDRINDV